MGKDYMDSKQFKEEIDDDIVIALSDERINDFLGTHISTINPEEARRLLRANFIYFNQSRINNEIISKLIDVANSGDNKDLLLLDYCQTKWSMGQEIEKKILKNNSFILNDSGGYKPNIQRLIEEGIDKKIIKKISMISERVNAYCKIQEYAKIKAKKL